jgi:RNA-directed DNA polymerase
MRLETKNINEIKDSFASMRSKDDFLVLLNYCKKLLYGENYKPFEIKQLNYYSNVNVNKNRYLSFVVKKKSGDDRIIHAPKSGLKAIQKCLNLILQTVYQPHKAASGFVPNKSIVDNAKHHVGSIYVYNIDLKDFFPSIDQARVWGRLKHAPFNLNESNGNEILANIIAALCCHEMMVERIDENENWIKVIKNVLPQGAPTSPTITNIICERLDVRLTGVAKRFGLKYSRYADDITFSSMHNVYHNNSEFLAEVERIITDQNFTIKQSKTRLQKQGYRQEVTGLLVNERVNVQKRYIKQLRTWLYLWEKYSYEKANAYFMQHYITDKGHIKKNIPLMQNVIAGKLEYLKMVKGKDNPLFKKLKYRYTKLNASINKIEGIKKNSNIVNILDLIFTEGLDIAMDNFKVEK